MNALTVSALLRFSFGLIAKLWPNKNISLIAAARDALLCHCFVCGRFLRRNFKAGGGVLVEKRVADGLTGPVNERDRWRI